MKEELIILLRVSILKSYTVYTVTMFPYERALIKKGLLSFNEHTKTITITDKGQEVVDSLLEHYEVA